MKPRPFCTERSRMQNGLGLGSTYKAAADRAATAEKYAHRFDHRYATVASPASLRHQTVSISTRTRGNK
jgi:hypothetical protein